MHKHLMLVRQNSFDSLDDDTNSDLQMTHHRNTILDALDELELMEVDDDPNADQTDTDDDESQELEILDSATGPVVPPKIPTPLRSPRQRNEYVFNDLIDNYFTIFAQKESAAILPGNEKKVANIQLLQDRWICKKTDSACASTHCYVIPGSEEHFPLGHQHFPLGHQQLDCWASAMCKEASNATIDKPPNHRLFDLKAISPVLQHRLDTQAKTVTEPASSTPVVNVTFGNEFASLFKLNHTAPNTTTSEIGPAPISTSSLILPLHKPGNDMSIVAFCALYQLDDSIAAKFASHSFKEAHLLHYVTF
ncbi:hypothetical protein F4604DRAFT_1921024 [Suillus subluteus]|nr:hypothetical protein F4604DRAFT_1921024 [Suillus subluteus]